MQLPVYSREWKTAITGSVVLNVVGNEIVAKRRIKHAKRSGKYAFQPMVERNFEQENVCVRFLSTNRLQIFWIGLNLMSTSP